MLLFFRTVLTSSDKTQVEEGSDSRSRDSEPFEVVRELERKEE